MRKNSKGRVFVGLSGGVDSAVSAALLKKAGYEVTGLFARIALDGYPCSAMVDRQDALRVAAHLEIPFLDVDLSAAYRERVFQNAIEGYRRGETPNPDALCNREIKFGLLYDFAMEKGADFIATGHYARVKSGKNGTHLYAGKDPDKDQNYFLWAVPEERLARTLFPVGGYKKPQVRALAKKFGLPNAERPDSQGLCFLGGISMEEMLTQELQPQKGDVLDEWGKIVGTHRGAVLYTLGQRHGFALFPQSADESPRYVVAKDVQTNTITISAHPTMVIEARASGTKATLRETNWIGEISDRTCEARFRYRQKLLPARLEHAGGKATVVFKKPQQLPAGQSLVLYKKDRCLGGGIIDEIV